MCEPIAPLMDVHIITEGDINGKIYREESSKNTETESKEERMRKKLCLSELETEFLFS